MNNEELSELTKRLDELEKRVSNLESKKTVGSDHSPFSTKKFSLREFLISKKPNDDVKKVLAVGYFLEELEGFTSFNASDLRNAFKKVKEKKPLNINDKVNKNIRNGHMEEVAKKKDSRKAWHLTSTGEQFVKDDFSAPKQ